MAAEGGDPSGFKGVPDWNLKLDKAFNDKNGISTTILSLTAPGACIVKTPEGRARLARRCNEHLAKIRDDAPERYGFFATLPSMVDEADFLTEVAYALDTLKADGVTLFTRYGPGHQYLGHPDFGKIWDELERRKAVIFVHPTHPVDTQLVNPVMSQPVVQYPFETTITAVDMLFNKVPQKHANCKIILSHSGGALPFLYSRAGSGFEVGSQEHADFVDAARNFYFDTALSASDTVLKLMQDFAKPGHMLCGSDYPYAEERHIAHHLPNLAKFEFQRGDLRQEIYYKNALELFPRLAKYYQ